MSVCFYCGKLSLNANTVRTVAGEQVKMHDSCATKFDNEKPVDEHAGRYAAAPLDLDEDDDGGFDYVSGV
jgi:hypothetical protein